MKQDYQDQQKRSNMAAQPNLFEFIGSISKRNISRIDNMTEEEQKQFHPFVLQRWLTGTSNAQQIRLINEFSNKHVFRLSTKHKLLSWYVLAASCSGQSQRYVWKKAKSKSISNRPISESVLIELYQYDSRKASSALKLLEVQDVLDLAISLGYDDDLLKEIKKEFKGK